MIVHILNGDALADRFPSSVNGEIIVAREALVDGNTDGYSPEEFFENRKAFLHSAYDLPENEYEMKSRPEFKKIMALPEKTEVNLWFEDDLFCQVNLWFCCYLLHHFTDDTTNYLVRPTAELQYGFGGMDTEKLKTAFQNKTAITPFELATFALLWRCYQDRAFDKMLAVARSINEKFPFLIPAVQAHIDRFPQDELQGRPHRSLQEIMKKVGSDKFGPVFREFNKKEAIYGFGDLQVKRMFDELKKQK